MNKLIAITGTVILCLVFSSLIAQTDITFTFANGQISGTSPTYYEFDVMAQAGASGTRIGDTQVYINYNDVAFGQQIVTNGKVNVTKGTLMQGELVPGVSLYNIVNIADNTTSRVGITGDFAFDGTASGNTFPSTSTQLVHVQIEISNASENAGLAFEQSLMIGQQFESDGLTNYVPVVANDIDNSPLSTTSVSTLNSNIPKRFQLHQNYPNPFNPATTLRFDIPAIGSGLVDTRLVIYNLVGQMVKTLYQDKLSPGSYEIQWDGTTDFGNSAPSGIYFAVFRTDKFSQTRKLVLLK